MKNRGARWFCGRSAVARHADQLMMMGVQYCLPFTIVMTSPEGEWPFTGGGVQMFPPPGGTLQPGGQVPASDPGGGVDGGGRQQPPVQTSPFMHSVLVVQDGSPSGQVL